MTTWIKPLTRRQREIYSFIGDTIAKKGYAPSFKEIAKQFGLRSLATVHEHLLNLTRKGYIRRWRNEARAIELTDLARCPNCGAELSSTSLQEPGPLSGNGVQQPRGIVEVSA